ncbi:membrane integrity-associated transporter subunit PqiC [Ruegeria sp. HKCCD8929]|uniref:PqiC family protein n=1 Tax=Ruegeria sp. HKCCD8929 TaxID=2683006 RepID=UPI0014896D19|nr:PqiC family protein [Ruegeria sp. HKCCD8929]
MRIVLSLILTVALATACTPANDARYLISSAPGEKVANLRSRTIEVRLVSLPSYAAASDIVAEGEGGALLAFGGAQWADDPARGMTAALARGLNERTGASAAIEPWPLNTGPDARLDVRVDQVYAHADGIFELTGQFAVSSPEGTVREFVRRFGIRKPVNGTGPSATAEALARALAELARQVSLSM